MLMAILRAGANVNGTDKSGTTALIGATVGGNSRCAATLIAAGADVNMTGPDGVTPLMNACVLCNKGCVMALLEAELM